MSVVNEDWVVRTKRKIKVGDKISPLRAPRRNGYVVFTPVVGVVTAITKNHIELEVAGEESKFYVYADCLFAVDPEWSAGDEDE